MLYNVMDGSAFCDKNAQISSLYCFFYRFLFIPGSTAHKLDHKQKAHVLLCKVGQRLLCVLQCHWLATSTSLKIHFDWLIDMHLNRSSPYDLQEKDNFTAFEIGENGGKWNTVVIPCLTLAHILDFQCQTKSIMNSQQNGMLSYSNIKRGVDEIIVCIM